MKIILFAFFCEGMWEIHEELGISFIAATLRQAGHEVVIQSINENFDNYQSIIKFSPQVIGFTVYEINKKYIYDFCEVLSKILQNTLLCVGGALPTYNGLKILEDCRSIDVAVIGEGERAFLDIVSCVMRGENLSNVNGIIYRDGGMIVNNHVRGLIPNLDTLGFPVRDMLIEKNIKIAQISTSRGCLSRCSFCLVQLFGQKWRGRQLSSVLDEIQFLVKTHEIYAFNIIDSSFEDPTLERMLDFAKGILDRRLTIVYYIQMRAETYCKLNEENINLLKRSGLSSVCIGLEAGNEEDIKIYNKFASMSQMQAAVNFFTRNHINVDPGFINFNPYTNIQKLYENISFLQENGFAANPDYILKYTKIYEGTPLYKKAYADGLIISEGSKLGFKFLHSEIEIFYKYIQMYLEGGASSEQVIFRALCHGASFVNVSFASINSLLSYESDMEAIILTEKYWREYKKFQKELNIKISQWFCRLLCLIETGWEHSKADDISKKYLDKGFLQRAAIKYKYLWNQYLYFILKRDIKQPIKTLALYLNNE